MLRPRGQVLVVSQRLDFALKTGFVVRGRTRPGQALPPARGPGAPATSSTGDAMEALETLSGGRPALQSWRVFLEDGDTLVFRGGHRGVGFGECRASLKEPPHGTDK
ncbi:MAG: hypothetical protein AB7S38_18900 [Vulcanimicrobiota bacterium]